MNSVVYTKPSRTETNNNYDDEYSEDPNYRDRFNPNLDVNWLEFSVSSQLLLEGEEISQNIYERPERKVPLKYEYQLSIIDAQQNMQRLEYLDQQEIIKWREVDQFPQGKAKTIDSTLSDNKTKHFKIPFKFKYIKCDVVITV